MSKRRDPRYMAIGLHEYGHAENAERSRFPRLRAVGPNIASESSVGVGTVAGLLGRSKFGLAGGALLGAGVSGLASLPILIEEHQATRNALKMMKEDGDLSSSEYNQAEKSLKTAYRSYVTDALNRAAVSGSIGSGNIGAASGLIGGSLVNTHITKNKMRRDLSDVRGTRRDSRSIQRIKNKRGLKADTYHTPIKSGLPSAYYAPPHAHVRDVITRRDYKKALQERTKSKIRKSTLDRGAVFYPMHEKDAAFVPQGVTTAARHVQRATTGFARGARNLAEDAVNFSKDGPYHQARKFMGYYRKDPTFRGNVNAYYGGKAVDAVNRFNGSPTAQNLTQNIIT